MATPTQRVTERFRQLLMGESGLAQSIAALRDRPESVLRAQSAERVGSAQASAEIQEKSGVNEYPVFQVYVAKIENTMREKFRSFSGTIHLVTEVRVSGDRLEGLTEELHFYADAVADVIERSRGDLGDGIILSGAYETVFEPAKKGGLHYQQTARVTCEAGLSRH